MISFMKVTAMKKHYKIILLGLALVSPLYASEDEFIKVFESHPSLKIIGLAVDRARQANFPTIPVPESLDDIEQLLDGHSPEEIQSIMYKGGDTLLSDVQQAINRFNEVRNNPLLPIYSNLHEIFLKDDPYMKAVKKFFKNTTKK